MRRLASAGLTLLILGMATIALAMVVVPSVAGVKAFTVDRSSMQSVISFGSLEYSKAQTSYEVGDAVVFTHNGHTITHFLHAKLPNPATGELDGSWWTTKGSENLAPDPWEVPTTSIVGRVVWHAPLVGLATKVVATPTVALFLILVAAGLWWASTSPRKQTLPAAEAVGNLGEQV